ncbi:hypothetical protein TcWFU_004380 [Taenia crassiceps]|uniref:Uncharacterized protein n=1 Tax=Taenia crassiceps TaxID=6207 RepID=A0ABR4Q4J6_9CEST
MEREGGREEEEEEEEERSGVEWRGRGDAGEDHAYSAAFLSTSTSTFLPRKTHAGSFKPILAPLPCTITSPEGRF